MAREPKVLDEEIEYLGPVAVAMFVELGWIRLYPMTWTKGGLSALRKGYGRWDGAATAVRIHSMRAWSRPLG